MSKLQPHSEQNTGILCALHPQEEPHSILFRISRLRISRARQKIRVSGTRHTL